MGNTNHDYYCFIYCLDIHYTRYRFVTRPFVKYFKTNTRLWISIVL
nr:MAG TPA: hypothetical protein [Bacteriophage sp.]